MSFNLFGARSAPDPLRVAAIKRWVADAFVLDDGILVMVTELQCTEPGCPPIETVIALMGGPDGRKQFKLHARIAEITRDQVTRLATESHDHDDGERDERPAPRTFHPSDVTVPGRRPDTSQGVTRWRPRRWTRAYR